MADTGLLTRLAADAAAVSGPSPLPVVPGYEILDELGHGGMGVVYRARHVGMNRLAALKLLPGRDAADPRDAARFLAEAEAAAAVHHPHVVPVYDCATAGGRPFLAMEYMPGGTLAERLKRDGRLGARAAAELVRKLAAGVQAVHEKGIVHRDLKPGNVLFDAAGEPKVADFGLAGRAASDPTAARAVMGTPAYMSPEQAAGAGRFVGPPADVWALGVVLYECLTGRRPFDAADTPSVLGRIINDDPPRPRTLAPGLPRNLEHIALKCLTKDPADRYPTAGDLADDLGLFRDGRPVVARPVGSVERFVRLCRRNPTVAGLIALLLTCVVAYSVLLRTKNAQLERESDDKENARQEAVDRQQAAEVIAYNLAVRDADREWLDGRADKALDKLDQCLPHLRGWEWHYLRRRCGAGQTLLGRHDGGVLAIAVLPDSTRARSAGRDGLVRDWDLPGRRAVGTPFPVGDSDEIRSGRCLLAFDPSGRFLAVLGPGSDRCTIWDCDARRSVRSVPVPGGPDGSPTSVSLTRGGSGGRWWATNS